MIFKLLIEIVLSILSFISGLISSMLPEIDFFSDMSTLFSTMLSVCNQAINFLYFIFGDSFYIIMTCLPVLFAEKFIILPLISGIRRLFSSGFGSGWLYN